LHHDAAAIAAIASVGSTFGNVLFSPETSAAVASIAGDDFDLDAVDKHGSNLTMGGAAHRDAQN
jgi:hypothetical protein